MNTIEIICDGGCLNNQDPNNRQAYGSFILKVSPELIPFPPIIHKRFYGNKTNNEAEYMALIDALTWIKEVYKRVDKLIINTDSQLLIGQLYQGWKVNKPHLLELYTKANSLINDITKYPPLAEVEFKKINEKDMKQIIGH